MALILGDPCVAPSADVVLRGAGQSRAIWLISRELPSEQLAHESGTNLVLHNQVQRVKQAKQRSESNEKNFKI
jgi:hypothetical protein